MELSKQICKPCEGGAVPIRDAEVQKYLAELSGWAQEGKKIKKSFFLADFKGAMVFVNKIADIAESEGHHPDIFIFYNKVDIALWTYAIGGLSLNDFILAAKIDAVS